MSAEILHRDQFATAGLEVNADLQVVDGVLHIGPVRLREGEEDRSFTTVFTHSRESTEAVVATVYLVEQVETKELTVIVDECTATDEKFFFEGSPYRVIHLLAHGKAPKGSTWDSSAFVVWDVKAGVSDG